MPCVCVLLRGDDGSSEKFRPPSVWSPIVLNALLHITVTSRHVPHLTPHSQRHPPRLFLRERAPRHRVVVLLRLRGAAAEQRQLRERRHRRADVVAAGAWMRIRTAATIRILSILPHVAPVVHPRPEARAGQRASP
eukprot:31451-Pelagococcus_subviridis.AAC.1